MAKPSPISVGSLRTISLASMPRAQPLPTLRAIRNGFVAAGADVQKFVAEAIAAGAFLRARRGQLRSGSLDLG
ncbi:exported hypothetical protein [Mesorhizobium plurifarium]|uniref:Uncharacterized protein n=1 Tax=Mesorhizobium plurifarium TaxID=69974 RepID=A0A090EKA6_MESPL|nr:exported hypothetical protein [Mesorhizobium plurifarium]